MNYSFENLKVWHTSRELVKDIDHVTSTFPHNEKFGLAIQLKRTSIAMCSNVVTGSTRWSRESQSRYYEIAFNDLVALLNQLTLATYLNYLPEDQLSILRAKIDRTGQLLNALSRNQYVTTSTN